MAATTTHNSTRHNIDKPEEECQVGGVNVLPLDEDNVNHGSNDANDNRTKKKQTGWVSVTKRRRKKKWKGTAPDAVTCINTYFCVINVYMCQRNRSLALVASQPRLIWTVIQVHTDTCMKLCSASTSMKTTISNCIKSEQM